jgi:hypothetical protein
MSGRPVARRARPAEVFATLRDFTGMLRARSHYGFVPPLIQFIPDSLTYLVPLFL